MTNLDQLVKQSIQPYLKSVGFKKKGLQWNRDRGDFVDVVTIQSAKYSTSEKQVFTVNLGVFVKSFYEAVWQQSLGGFAMEADCVVRVRLVDLIQGKPYGDALDQWWEIEPLSTDGSVGTEIEKALIDLGIPFLEQFENYEITADHLQKLEGWQSKNPLIALYLALAEWKTGAPKVALETLRAIKGEVWKAKADVIHRLIESH